MRRRRNRKISIYRELGLLLVLAAAVSALLFLGLHRAVTEGINRFAWNGAYLAREDARRLQSLQQFIRQNSLRLEDVEQLTDWVRRQAVVSIQIYRGGELYYDSDYGGYGREDFGDEMGPPPWSDLRNITFADGDAQVLLYGFYVFQMYHYALILELLLIFTLFLTIVMLGIRREIRYIRSLSREIKILEGGGLEYPITVSGRDELAELAQGLDAMRLSFLEQNRQEKQLAQASQRMVTEMSHDLRTPLTSIMLYTEILLGRRFKDEAQMMEYVEKIDKKARRLKHLTDHLFEYALVTGTDRAELEGPAPLRAVVFDLLSETAAHLEQEGFPLELDLRWEERRVCFNREYVSRIFDNLTSNVVKYGLRDAPVRIRTVYREELAGFSVESRKAPLERPPESTKIGLSNIRSMMEKMKGSCQVEEGEETFRLTLLFAESGS